MTGLQTLWKLWLSKAVFDYSAVYLQPGNVDFSEIYLTRLNSVITLQLRIASQSQNNCILSHYIWWTGPCNLVPHFRKIRISLREKNMNMTNFMSISLPLPFSCSLSLSPPQEELKCPPDISKSLRKRFEVLDEDDLE